MENLKTFIENNNLTEIKKSLQTLNCVDIAECLSEFDNQTTFKVFRLLPKAEATDVFSYLEPEQQQHIIQMFTDSEVESLVDEMFLDDTVDLLEEVPAAVVKKVLKNCDPEKRNLINRFLQYPEDSAGSMMTIEFVDLYENITVAQAITRIRNLKIDKETINTLYIKGRNRTLVGTLSIHKLLTSDDDVIIRDIMDETFICVNTFDDREKIADICRRYDLMSIPVTDNENTMVSNLIGAGGIGSVMLSMKKIQKTLKKWLLWHHLKIFI